jgi:hypothetical protein
MIVQFNGRADRMSVAMAIDGGKNSRMSQRSSGFTRWIPGSRKMRAPE